MTNDTIAIIKFFKNLWVAIKGFTFKAEIVNQIEIPEVIIPEVNIPEYPDNIEVNNFPDYTDAIKGSSSDVIKYLDIALRKLEPTKDKEVIVLLNKIIEVLSAEKKDLTPEIIKEIRSIVKSIEKKDIDLSGIERKFSGLKNDLYKFTKYDEIKVRLPDKQIDAMSNSIIASSGGSSNVTDTLGKQINPATKEKQDDTITAIEAISGLQRATNLVGNGLVSVGTTAVEVEISGTPESLIITYPAITANTGQLYIGKSNVTNLGANAIAVLLPGQSATIDYNDTTNAIYVVSDTASQSFIGGGLL